MTCEGKHIIRCLSLLLPDELLIALFRSFDCQILISINLIHLYIGSSFGAEKTCFLSLKPCIVVNSPESHLDSQPPPVTPFFLKSCLIFGIRRKWLILTFLLCSTSMTFPNLNIPFFSLTNYWNSLFSQLATCQPYMFSPNAYHHCQCGHFTLNFNLHVPKPPSSSNPHLRNMVYFGSHSKISF